MSLFDNLFDISSCDINFEIWEDVNDLKDSDDGPDEVCPSNHETGPPFETSQSTTPSLAGLEERTNKRGNSIGSRISTLTKSDKGTPPNFDVILTKTGVSKSSYYKLRTKAISRGWIPGLVVKVEYIDDTPRTGRPKISITIALFIIEIMTKNSTTRGWSCARIVAEVTGTPGRQPVSASTIYKVLSEHGYGVFKRTVKPGLTDEAKKARLTWYLEREYWIINNWKNVIFSDETSIILKGVRGKRRV